MKPQGRALWLRITHVIRGDDHVSNTPKQIALYRAFGNEPPVFAHVPMILRDDGKKLSKRHGATAVGDYQDKGILPAAMRNFVALLGWSPGGDREILPEAEMIAAFSLEGIQKKPAVFDTAKLEWMNGQYLSQLSAQDLLAPTERELARMGVAASGRDLRPLIDAVKARSRTILNIAEQVAVRLDPSRVVRDAKGEQLAAKLGVAFGANLAVVAEGLERIPASRSRWPHTACTTRSMTITMLPVAVSPLLLLAFVLQAVFAILAAVGVWRAQRWAAAALLLLGASIAATVLIEAFVFGIIAWLYALLIAIAAIVIALLLGAYVNRSSPPPT